MRIIIVGANITGLYLGYLFKKHNLTYEIYDKEIDYTYDIIRPNYVNTLQLINQMNINYSTVIGKQNLSTDFDVTKYNTILTKIRNEYIQKLPKNITTISFIESILSLPEFYYFNNQLSILTQKLLQTEISMFMENNFLSLQILYPNQYIQLNNNVIDNLIKEVRSNLYLEKDITEISYQPITRSYLLKINDTLYAADKIIIARNNNIKINILPLINTYIHPIKYFLTKINCNVPTEDKSTSEICYQNGEGYRNIYNDTTGKEKITHIAKSYYEINYWNKYGLMLCGDFSTPLNIEDKCKNAKKTFLSINETFFIDKLKHEPDNVTSIEVNRL